MVSAVLSAVGLIREVEPGAQGTPKCSGLLLGAVFGAMGFGGEYSDEVVHPKSGMPAGRSLDLEQLRSHQFAERVRAIRIVDV